MTSGQEPWRPSILPELHGAFTHRGAFAIAAKAFVGPDGKLYAHGTTTCLVFELKPR